jgi:predicted nucleic acid-binding protein
MTVLDTDYLFALLIGNTVATAHTNKIENPNTTVINAFELHSANRSTEPKKSRTEVNSLLKSMDVLGFEMPDVLTSAKIG